MSQLIGSTTLPVVVASLPPSWSALPLPAPFVGNIQLIKSIVMMSTLVIALFSYWHRLTHVRQDDQPHLLLLFFRLALTLSFFLSLSYYFLPHLSLFLSHLSLSLTTNLLPVIICQKLTKLQTIEKVRK